MTPLMYFSSPMAGMFLLYIVKVRSGSGIGPVRLFPKGPGPVRSGKLKGPRNTTIEFVGIFMITTTYVLYYIQEWC